MPIKKVYGWEFRYSGDLAANAKIVSIAWVAGNERRELTYHDVIGLFCDYYGANCDLGSSRKGIHGADEPKAV